MYGNYGVLAWTTAEEMGKKGENEIVMSSYQIEIPCIHVERDT